MVSTPAIYQERIVILIVDDDPNVTAFLSDALSRDGFEVVQARDGVEAYEYVRKPECKLMLLDLQMPRLNGVELLLAMKHDGIDVPAIIVTGLSTIEEDAIKDLPGVVSLLRKPFTIEQLETSVRDMLDKSGQ